MPPVADEAKKPEPKKTTMPPAGQVKELKEAVLAGNRIIAILDKTKLSLVWRQYIANSVVETLDSEQRLTEGK